MNITVVHTLHVILTFVVGDQILQGVEGDAWRDVEPAVVQRADLIMLHGVSCLRVAVSDGQRVAS